MCEILQGEFHKGVQGPTPQGVLWEFWAFFSESFGDRETSKDASNDLFFVCALCTYIFLGLGNPDFLILFLEKYFRNIRGFFLIWWAYFWKTQGIEKKLIGVRYSFSSNFFSVITKLYVCQSYKICSSRNLCLLTSTLKL